MSEIRLARWLLLLAGTGLLAGAFWGLERLAKAGAGRGERFRLAVLASGTGAMAGALLGLGIAGANAACETMLLVAIVGLGSFGVADSARKTLRGWWHK